MKNIFAASVLVLASACASSPNKIAPQYVSPVTYQNWDCQQMDAEMNRTMRRSNELYSSLQKEANADQWQMGVGLVLFWPALFLLEGGDGPEAAEYAQLRGEYKTLNDVSIAKKCGMEYQADLNDVVKAANADDSVVVDAYADAVADAAE
jgi:hypothetical protein